jgi:hypothetical protein
VIRDFAEAENAHQQPDMSRRGVFWQAPAPAPVVAAKKEVEEDDTTGRAEARAVAREAASAMLSSTEDEEEEEVEKYTEEEVDDTEQRRWRRVAAFLAVFDVYRHFFSWRTTYLGRYTLGSYCWPTRDT